MSTLASLCTTALCTALVIARCTLFVLDSVIVIHHGFGGKKAISNIHLQHIYELIIK